MIRGLHHGADFLIPPKTLHFEYTDGSVRVVDYDDSPVEPTWVATWNPTSGLTAGERIAGAHKPELARACAAFFVRHKVNA